MQPKYLQLSEELQRRIDSGEWTTGDCIPSEVALAKEYGVAYMTVRAAVSALAQAGRLRRIRGRGTFVVEPRQPDTIPMLGLLLPPKWHGLDPFYFPQIVAGFTDRSEELGYRVHLGDRSEPLIEFIQLRELHVGAVACVMIQERDVQEAESLLDRGVAVVAINHYQGSRRITSISPDNRHGSSEAARLLLSLGHRRFTYLAGPPDNLDAGQRLLGVRQALRSAGHRPAILPGGFSEASGYERTAELIRSGSVPTALIACSDLAAIGAMKALAEAGIRVPDEVSVMGFGDFRPSAYMHPSLSSVQLPLYGVGVRASELLIDEISGRRAQSQLLPCPVLVRESVAPPRADRS
ncbi:GntR family transcriptional regulator [bacterium]|nr:MAG: GntR family transcriptional regulator [bacterium]